jgi:hypothetical protein
MSLVTAEQTVLFSEETILTLVFLLGSELSLAASASFSTFAIYKSLALEFGLSDLRR